MSNSNLNLLIDAETESGIVDDIDRKRFYTIIGKMDINLAKFFEQELYTQQDLNLLNETLKDLKFMYRFKIIDCLNILFNDFIVSKAFNNIINMFDNETREIIRKELSEKFHIKITKTNLSKFFA